MAVGESYIRILQNRGATAHEPVYIFDVAMPLEIVGLGQTSVTFVWSDDHKVVQTAQKLRQECSCAHCKSEMTGERILDPNTIPPDIAVTHMEIVGNYGVSIHFSDGHTTGIYRFAELADEST